MGAESIIADPALKWEPRAANGVLRPVDETASSFIRPKDVATLLACVFGLATSLLALTGYASGPFVYPLSHAFGWSRAAILSAPSLLTLVTLVTSFGIGWLTDKAWPNLLAGASQIAFGCSFFALAAFTTSDLKVFYLIHFVMAVLAAGTLPMVFNRIVAATFVNKRGMAMGVMMTGSGVSGLFVPPYLTFLISHFGWRVGFVGLGAFPVAVGLLLSLPILPRTRPDKAVTTLSPAATAGVSLSTALRDRRFWTMGFVFFLGSGLSTSIVSNLIPFLRDEGVPTFAAAGALSAFGFAVILGRLGVGYLIDHFWAPPVAMAVMLPASGALIYMASHAIGLTDAYVCSVFLGFAAGAEADMLAFLPVRYFGVRQNGRIYAVLFVLFVAGIGLAGPLFGAVYDHFHSYKVAFYGAAAAWVLCGLSLLTLGPYPRELSEANQSRPLAPSLVAAD